MLNFAAWAWQAYPMDHRRLEARFDAAMHDIYVRAAADCNYRATRYLQMLRRRGGVETAKVFLRRKGVSSGFERLRECGRLDLTVEAHVLKPEFASLFTEDERAVARARLQS